MLDKPVKINMLNGTLHANRMAIINSGDLIRFDRGVQLTTFLNPAEIKQKTSDADDNASGGTNSAPNNTSGGKTTQLVLTRLPRPDPRRLVASRATAKRRAPTRLRP